MFDLLLLLPLPRVEAPSSVPEELPVSAKFSTPPDRFTPPEQILSCRVIYKWRSRDVGLAPTFVVA